MLVFIRKLSQSTYRWVHMCQGFSHFSPFLYHFEMAKLATTSMRVKPYIVSWNTPEQRSFCNLPFSTTRCLEIYILQSQKNLWLQNKTSYKSEIINHKVFFSCEIVGLLKRIQCIKSNPWGASQNWWLFGQLPLSFDFGRTKTSTTEYWLLTRADGNNRTGSHFLLIFIRSSENHLYNGECSLNPLILISPSF